METSDGNLYSYGIYLVVVGFRYEKTSLSCGSILIVTAIEFLMTSVESFPHRRLLPLGCPNCNNGDYRVSSLVCLVSEWIY